MESGKIDITDWALVEQSGTTWKWQRNKDEMWRMVTTDGRAMTGWYDAPHLALAEWKKITGAGPS